MINYFEPFPSRLADQQDTADLQIYFCPQCQDYFSFLCIGQSKQARQISYLSLIREHLEEHLIK